MGTEMRAFMFAASSIIALVCATGVAAQEAGGQAQAGASEGLADIVVTAQKRSENVQDVPVAITAFSGEAIAQRGITGVQQLGALSPGVNLDETSPFSGSYNVLAASIRGVGQDDFALNVDPGVGVYVDGVYLARTVGANQDLMDVERIEVLKGPQGTLFGRNSIGGAISIVTTTITKTTAKISINCFWCNKVSIFDKFNGTTNAFNNIFIALVFRGNNNASKLYF